MEVKGARTRSTQYDILRIIASFLVITIHACVFDQKDIITSSGASFEIIGYYSWQVVARWAVPAFVMISGMFTIKNADSISIGKLLKKRVIRMLVIFVVWSAVYSAYNTFVIGNVYASTPIKTFIDGCFSGELHMWYIPMMAGLYLISPLLAILVKNTEKKWAIFWLSIMFIFASVIPFIENANLSLISTTVKNINTYIDLRFLCGYTFYYVLGYYINNHNFTKKERVTIYCAAIAAFIFTYFGTAVMAILKGEPMGVLPYEYPNIVLMSIGVVVFFKEIIGKIKFKERTANIISLISKLTLGIYLIHLLVLEVLYNVGVNVQFSNPLISIPIVSLITFVVGAIITWIIRLIPKLGKYIV